VKKISTVIKSKHLGGFALMPCRTDQGQCPECATKHGPEQPHNKQSLYYQYKFMAAHGKWPGWKDAMKHCTAAVKKIWTRELRKRGEKV